MLKYMVYILWKMYYRDNITAVVVIDMSFWRESLEVFNSNFRAAFNISLSGDTDLNVAGLSNEEAFRIL